MPDVGVQQPSQRGFLGAGLRGGYRDKAFVMTKVCTHGRDASVGMAQLEESLQRLGTDHLHLWQIHAVTYDNAPFHSADVNFSRRKLATRGRAALRDERSGRDDDLDRLRIARLAHVAPTAVARVKSREALADLLTLVRLRGLPPSDLDQQYLLAQVGGHLSAISVYQTEIAHGTNRALQAFASGELPTLREHLEVAYMDVGHVAGDNPLRPPGGE